MLFTNILLLYIITVDFNLSSQDMTEMQIHEILQSIPLTGKTFLSSCYVFVTLSAFSLVFVLRSGHSLDHWRIFDFFALRNSLVSFAECCELLSSCAVKHLLYWIIFAICVNLSRKYRPLHFTIHPATSINKH